MQPLKQQGDPRFPLEADALLLLRSVERYEPPPGQKQRVTAHLLARGSVGRARVIRVPMVLAVILCAAGASAAAASGPWLARSYRALVAASTDEESSASRIAVSKARVGARAIARVEPKPAVVAEARPAPAVEVSTPEPPASLRALESTSAREEVASAARARSAATSEPASLVFGAMQALRREGRPDRAAKLLDEYRRRYPSGALAEEALALSVEAATLRGDPRAKTLAEAYLARYPGGQFQKAAERARALFSP